MNLYNSIIRNERSADVMLAKGPGGHSHAKRNQDLQALNPRWGRNLVKEAGAAKRKLFYDEFQSMNNSMSVNHDDNSTLISK